MAITININGLTLCCAVWYPGLASHPSHAIATRQMAGGGSVISFTVKGSGRRLPLFLVVRSKLEDLNPRFSLDGAWIAHQSDESTRHEVYVRPFRGDGSAVPYEVSEDGQRFLMNAPLNPQTAPLVLIQNWKL